MRLRSFLLRPFPLLALAATPGAQQPVNAVSLAFDDRVVASSQGAEVHLHGDASLAAPDLALLLEAGSLDARFALRAALTVGLDAVSGGAFDESFALPLTALPSFELEGDVLVQPYAELSARVAGSAEAGMRVSLVGELAAPVRVRFRGNALSFDLEEPPRFLARATVPEVSGGDQHAVELSLSGTLAFVVSVDGVVIAGPHASADSTFSLSIAPAANPWWSVEGALDVHAGALGGGERQVWSEARTLAAAGAPFPFAGVPSARWSVAWDLGSNERARSIAPSADGFALVGPGSGPGGAAWFARTDAGGALTQELQALVGPGPPARPEEVWPTADGGLLVGGNVGLTGSARVERLRADGSVAWGRRYADALGGTLFLGSLVPLDGGGALFCAKIGRGAESIPALVAVDALGNVLAAAEIRLDPAIDFAVPLRIAPSVDGWLVAGFAYYTDAAHTIGSRNGFLVKLDALGNPLFGRVIGGTGFDQTFGVAESDDGSIALVGELRSGNPLASWVACFDAEGETLWSATYGGGSAGGNDGWRTVAAVPGGGFLLGGHRSIGQNADAQLALIEPGGMPVWWKTIEGAGFDDVDDVMWIDGGLVFAGASDSHATGTPPVTDSWVGRASVDGLLRFDAAAPFAITSPAILWERRDVPSIALATTLAPLTLTSVSAPLVLAPVSAVVTELAH